MIVLAADPRLQSMKSEAQTLIYRLAQAATSLSLVPPPPPPPPHMADSNPFAATLDVLASLLPEHLQKPRVGIVCGSGLSTLASSLRDKVEVPYTALHGFGTSTGASHAVLGCPAMCT
jgi:hypothetical protein